MKIAVCVKQVPSRDWRPRPNDARTWVDDRDAAFEMNEPDAYALEEALRLKEEHGGEVVVCSAGPARVAQVIREALARGADRAIHVESDALASADAAAVADALAAAMRDDAFDLILTGLQSDDQGFAQTGVVLAERLGRPHATIIMDVQVEKAAGGVGPPAPDRGVGARGAIKVKRELEGGWFQWVSMSLPAVLTIQSGINQLRYATLKGIMAAKKKEVRTVQPSTPARRLRIVSLSAPEKQKKTEILGGTPTEAAQALVKRLREDARVIPVILVIAEARDDRLNRASWEAVAAAQQTAAGEPVTIAIAGGRVDATARELAAAAVAEVVTVAHDALASYTADAFVAAFAGAIAALGPSLVILPHTYQTRDFAPALAARLDRPLVTDVVAMKGSGADRLFTRPMFQGKLVADVALEGETPHLATCQIGAYRADRAVRGEKPAPIRPLAVSIDPSAIRQRPEPPFQEAKQAVDLSQAERIVSVGRGIKGPEHLPLAEQLAAALGAELAASRPICDAGWLPMARQVGSSGQTVSPKLYLALGISGAIQHLVGMKASQTIVAINKDADAPIFEVADYGIVGDLFEVVPALVAALKA